MTLRDATQRWMAMRTHRVTTLPIAILMPHSSCDCRCVMCDIWKAPGERWKLTENDIQGVLDSLVRLRTRWVVLSGGEPLLNPELPELCRRLKGAGVAKITLLSTGQRLTNEARRLSGSVDEVIVSLDGTEPVHDAIRRTPGAYANLVRGVEAVRTHLPGAAVTGRSVIQRLNFAVWSDIVESARGMGLDGISFLPADVTSEAFNRSIPWSDRRRSQVAPEVDELPRLEGALEELLERCREELASGFIAESPEKLRRIVEYYAAHHGRGRFPKVRCNAPWVSAVVEADGSVRPCFFHAPFGNLEGESLGRLINGPEAVRFRRALDVGSDPVCRRCVCSLFLRPGESIEAP